MRIHCRLGYSRPPARGPHAVSVAGAPAGKAPGVLIEAALVGFVVAVGAGITAIGVAAAVMAFRTAVTDVARWRQSRRSRLWQATDGRIERALITREGHGSRTIWGARVRYSYCVGGTNHQGSRVRFVTTFGQYARVADGARADVAKYAAGAAVTVYYDPADPARATLERNRTGLAFGLTVVVLLLIAAFALVGAGLHVLVGPMQEPPAFAPGELPPLAAQSGALLLLIAGTLAVLGASAARRARGQRSLQQFVDRAREYRGGSDAGKAVAVFGRADGSSAEPLRAPPHGVPALAYRVRAVAAGVPVLEQEARCDFNIASEHGPVRVHGQGARCELPRNRTTDDEAARAWVDAAWMGREGPAPGTFFVESAILAPGDQALAIGRLRVGRDGGLEIRAGGEDAPLLLAAEPLAVLRRRLRAPRRRATACAWASAASFVGAVVLLLL